MTIKEAIYREIRFGLCGAGGALNGIVSPDHVVLDRRLSPSSSKSSSDYPWIVFSRGSSPEDNQINYANARFTFSLIGMTTSATKGDELLESIRDIMINHFSGKHKRYGKYLANGTADPTGGIVIAMVYVDTSEDIDNTLNEKVQTLIFTANYIRA